MADLNAGTKVCKNCEQNINLASFLMHEVFCFKNIVKCDLCKKPYDKNIKEEHIEEFHAKVPCECGELIEKMFLVSHKLETCKRRQAQCFYCELSLDFDKLPQHMEFCGSRTEKCNKCNRYIQAKDQAQHDIQNCNYPEIKAKKTEIVMPSRSNGRNSANGVRNAAHASNFKRENSDASKSFSLLPCEFCSEYFTSDILLDHQDFCMQNPNARNTNYNDNRIQNDFDFLDQRFPTSSNEKIPCEFCKKLLDFDDIILHQSGCEANVTPRETPTTRFRSNLQPKPLVRPAPLQTKTTSTAFFSESKLNNVSQPQIKVEPSKYKVVRPKNLSNNDDSNDELRGINKAGVSSSKAKTSNTNELGRSHSPLSKATSSSRISKQFKGNKLPEPTIKRMESSSNAYTLPSIPISPIVHESRLNATKKTSPATNLPAQRSNSASLKKDTAGGNKSLKK